MWKQNTGHLTTYWNTTCTRILSNLCTQTIRVENNQWQRRETCELQASNHKLTSSAYKKANFILETPHRPIYALSVCIFLLVGRFRLSVISKTYRLDFSVIKTIFAYSSTQRENIYNFYSLGCTSIVFHLLHISKGNFFLSYMNSYNAISKFRH